MYCQKCGTQLEQIKLCASLWIAFYGCENCAQSYLEVADTRWIYSLLFLDYSILDLALAASDEQLEFAASKINFINYKTVSIIEFEEVLRQNR